MKKAEIVITDDMDEEKMASELLVFFNTVAELARVTASDLSEMVDKFEEEIGDAYLMRIKTDESPTLRLVHNADAR